MSLSDEVGHCSLLELEKVVVQIVCANDFCEEVPLFELVLNFINLAG